MAGDVSLVVTPPAAKDLQEAHDWYEGRQPGLGRAYMDAVDSTFQRILRGPEGFEVVARDARRALVFKFPYTFYFRIRGNIVRILDVIHHSRDPRVARSRIGRP